VDRQPHEPAFVLVHSPIVGPDTWTPVAAVLEARGWTALVPDLVDDGSSPLWRQHVDAVVTQVAGHGATDAPLVIAGHSGAGQLLEHIGDELRRTGSVVVGYLHVDAGVPTDGRSRLTQLRDEAPDLAEELEAVLDAGGRFPDWNDELLTALVPDPDRRAVLVAGIRHQPPAYWTETIPAVADDATPRGVLLLSDGYVATERAAIARGWPLRDVAARNHFHHLVDPGEVTDAMLELVTGLRSRDDVDSER
jgi:hypothetical protein